MGQLFMRIPQFISLMTNSTKLSFILWEIINDRKDDTYTVKSNQIKSNQSYLLFYSTRLKNDNLFKAFG